MPEDTYTYSEGVSISVAYVTGTIALAKSINPTLKCEEIKIDCIGVTMRN